jgi:hypothetical protein
VDAMASIASSARPARRLVPSMPTVLPIASDTPAGRFRDVIRRG